MADEICKTMTMDAGGPVGVNQNSVTPGPRARVAYENSFSQRT
jgi:hypothetical protein